MFQFVQSKQNVDWRMVFFIDSVNREVIDNIRSKPFIVVTPQPFVDSLTDGLPKLYAVQMIVRVLEAKLWISLRNACAVFRDRGRKSHGSQRILRICIRFAE
jgi:hypothetical protein